MYKKFKLNNGLRIVAHRMGHMRSVALGIWIKAGGRYESEKNKGISHFIEHLLFKGSKKYSCRRIKESIEGVGGSLNGFTSEELTCYLIKAPERHLGLAVDILSDMCINPLFDAGEIEKERGVILEEIKMYMDLPHAHVYELLDELLWPGQPLGGSVAGTPEAVKNMSRDDLVGFKRDHYTAPNIVVSAAGPLDPDNFRRRIEKAFSGLGPAPLNTFVPAQDTRDRPRLKILDKATEQSHLALGFLGLKRDHPARYALALLHIILGANMSSRLFNEVREKRGLAYEIGTVAKYYADTGAFIVHAGTDNNNVGAAIEVILKELSLVKEKLVSEAELRRAKDFFLGQLMLALEDTLDHMLWIGESVASLNKTHTLKDIIREVNRLTRAEIRDIARVVIREDALRAALIGPLGSRHDTIYSGLRLK